MDGCAHSGVSNHRNSSFLCCAAAYCDGATVMYIKTPTPRVLGTYFQAHFPYTGINTPELGVVAGGNGFFFCGFLFSCLFFTDTGMGPHSQAAPLKVGGCLFGGFQKGVSDGQRELQIQLSDKMLTHRVLCNESM